MLEPAENRSKLQWLKDHAAMFRYHRKIYKELLSSDEIKVVESKKLKYIRIWVDLFLLYIIYMTFKGFVKKDKVFEMNFFIMSTIVIIGIIVILEIVSRLRNI